MKFLIGIQEYFFDTRIRKTKPAISPLSGTRIRNVLVISQEENFDFSVWRENLALNPESSLRFLCISNSSKISNPNEHNQISIGRESFGLDLFPRPNWLTQQKSDYDLIIVNNQEGNSRLESLAVSLSATYRVSVYPTKFAHFYHVVFHANSASEKELVLGLKEVLLKTLPL